MFWQPQAYLNRLILLFSQCVLVSCKFIEEVKKGVRAAITVKAFPTISSFILRRRMLFCTRHEMKREVCQEFASVQGLLGLLKSA
jgi:hypothetical protein